MALLATQYTTEFVLLIIGLVLYDGGLIRKLGAMTLFIEGLFLAQTSQVYVSDLTATPTNVFLFFTPAIQVALVIMFAVLIYVTASWSFITIGRILTGIRKGVKFTWTDYEEYLV